MAGQRQPTDLVLMKGKKHFTKAEVEARKNAEVVAPDDDIAPPSYLSAKQKKAFRKLAEQLARIKLVANVDCEALARLIIAQDQYVEVTKAIKKTPLMVEVPLFGEEINEKTGEKELVEIGMQKVVNGQRERLMIIQDRCMKQCRQGAADFGMTVASRCRLVVPKAEEKPENKYGRYTG